MAAAAPAAPRTSLVLSTYNWPQALRACLESIARQTVPPDQVVIADDGSSQETRRVILQSRHALPCELKHVWHPDLGFQLARIRNKALACVQADVVIMLDGDLVLHPRFVEDHIEHFSADRWTQGTRVMMNSRLSETMLADPTFWPSPLTAGLQKPLKVVRSRLIHKLTSRTRVKADKPTGCHQAFPLSMLLAVNGYNEEFQGWGAEDAELIVRLSNAGYPRIDFRMIAIACHLYHPERPRDRVSINNSLRDEAARNMITRAEKGVDQWLTAPDAWLYENQCEAVVAR